MPRICVFAGSRAGTATEYTNLAQRLGEELIRRDIGLVYGGASVGLMGVVAETMLAANGEVIGIVPADIWSRDHNRYDLTEFHTVSGLAERKQTMMGLADGFIALPGGLGTYDELLEVVAARSLGVHTKPIGVLDALGYFAPLRTLLDGAIVAGFASRRSRRLVLHDTDPRHLVSRLCRAWGAKLQRRPGEASDGELVAVVYSGAAARHAPVCPPPPRRRSAASVMPTAGG